MKTHHDFNDVRQNLSSQLWPENIQSHSCGCMGPQNGDPVCPCQMAYVTIINGRYVKTQDLGPVPSWKLPK